MIENSIKYFNKHPFYNAIVHAAGGIAVGILFARPYDGGHPLQWAILFGAIAVLGHVVPMFIKKSK